MRELIAVILLLMIFATGKADEPIWDVSTDPQHEAQVYYVNPDGGTRYHTRRDCPSMCEEYYNGMVAYTVDELPQGLKACLICGAPELTTPAPEVQQVYYVNSRGGKKYHIWKNCYSIDEEYYNDMEAYTADTLPQGLKPCTACGATAVATPTPEPPKVCYYVNPDGGTRYHTRRDCPSISEKYHSGMETYAADTLPQGLKPCTACGATAVATPTPEPPKVCYYVNPEGGTRYHTRRDCPSISEKYHSGMEAYAADALPQGLVECQICKDDESQQTDAPQTTLTEGTYIVGVDIPQGLYDFIGAEDASGTLAICNWDGSVENSWQVSTGWQTLANLYNEQVLEVPHGCQATWHLSLETSAFDTGTRNLRLNSAGTYQEGTDLAAGLYIVQNNGDASATVSLLNSADGSPMHVWLVEPGVMITLYVRAGCSVGIPEGCLLRSMTRDMLLQEGTSASIDHGRYASIMQLPGRTYTVTGQDDTSFVTVTNLQKNETHTCKLGKGEPFTLDLQIRGSAEYLVEFRHVDIQWEQGIS